MWRAIFFSRRWRLITAWVWACIRPHDKLRAQDTDWSSPTIRRDGWPSSCRLQTLAGRAQLPPELIRRDPFHEIVKFACGIIGLGWRVADELLVGVVRVGVFSFIAAGWVGLGGAVDIASPPSVRPVGNQHYGHVAVNIARRAVATASVGACIAYLEIA